MGAQPNRSWATSRDARPPSVTGDDVERFGC
jgi:hypothetical protein